MEILNHYARVVNEVWFLKKVLDRRRDLLGRREHDASFPLEGRAPFRQRSDDAIEALWKSRARSLAMPLWPGPRCGLQTSSVNISTSLPSDVGVPASASLEIGSRSA